MNETIRQTATLTEEENTALFKWGEDIWKGAGRALAGGGTVDTHFILELDGQPVCHLALLKHEVDVSGKPVLIAGISGVVTRPEAQGRGYARRLMQHAAEFYEREWKVDAGMLFALDHMEPYYLSLGWQKIEAPVMVDQPQGTIEAPYGVFVKPCAGREWPPGTVYLNRYAW